MAAVELEDPAGHVVEEIAVVGDRHDRTGVIVQKALDPGHGIGIEMIGRLVEEQHVGLLEQQPAQSDAPALAAGNVGDAGLARRTTQGVHGDLDPAIDVPCVRGIDTLLERRLHLDQRRHLGIVQRLGEARAQGLELGHHRPHRRHALGNALEHRLTRIELGLLRQVPNPNAFGRPRLAAEFDIAAGHDAQ